MSAPARIVMLEIEHSTSEDWLLRLPMRMGATTPWSTAPTAAENAATAEALAGAAAQLLLKGRRLDQSPAELFWGNHPSLIRIEGHEIVAEAAAGFFAGKAGAYAGDLLVRLAGGFEFVSHRVTLALRQAEGWRSP